MVAHRSFESSRRACCTSWGLMEMLRIAKVWQEFPQRYARARARLVGFCRSGFLCRRAVASEGHVVIAQRRKLSGLLKMLRAAWHEYVKSGARADVIEGQAARRLDSERCPRV